MQFPNPAMAEPDRWRLRKRKAGVWVIVDGDGQPVLEHWDPVVRLHNLHLAKAAPTQRFALAWAHHFIAGLAIERDFKSWILTLIQNAAADGIPKVDPAAVAAAVNRSEGMRGQGVAEIEREEAA